MGTVEHIRSILNVYEECFSLSFYRYSKLPAEWEPPKKQEFKEIVSVYLHDPKYMCSTLPIAEV